MKTLFLTIILAIVVVWSGERMVLAYYQTKPIGASWLDVLTCDFTVVKSTWLANDVIEEIQSGSFLDAASKMARLGESAKKVKNACNRKGIAPSKPVRASFQTAQAELRRHL